MKHPIFKRKPNRKDNPLYGLNRRVARKLGKSESLTRTCGHARGAHAGAGGSGRGFAGRAARRPADAPVAAPVGRLPVLPPALRPGNVRPAAGDGHGHRQELSCLHAGSAPGGTAWTHPDRRSHWSRDIAAAAEFVLKARGLDVYVGVGLSKADRGPTHRCMSDEVAGPWVTDKKRRGQP